MTGTKRPMAFRRMAHAFGLLVALWAQGARADGELMVQRRDYFGSTYFELMRDSIPCGTVVRSRLRGVLFQRYDLYDPAGVLLASGARSSVGLSSIFPSQARIRFTDGQKNLIGELVGSFFTTEKARYTLLSPEGEIWARLRVDLHATSIVAEHPDIPQRIYARMARQQPSDSAYQRWEISTPIEGPISEPIWALVGAFAADIWNKRADET